MLPQYAYLRTCEQYIIAMRGLNFQKWKMKGHLSHIKYSPYTQILNQKSHTNSQHSNVSILIQLNCNPCTSSRQAHYCNKRRSCNDLLRSESLLPIKSGTPFHLVWNAAYLTTHVIRIDRTLYQPSPQAVMVHTTNISSTLAGLNQGSSIIAITVITNPAIFRK